ncbi:alternative ribosome rescue factor ArfA [Neptuniibacter sp. SY11_33]|uniref:alternative ribosome rescue factor ArfA n=1 Tax=Neptuniibacter sp. SY11_33 TaxID=3398215 RepID=UPI0039F49D57
MKTKTTVSSTHEVDTGRGKIKQNHLAALVTSKIFKSQVVKAKKGKGAYKRKDKHKGRESYLIAA